MGPFTGTRNSRHTAHVAAYEGAIDCFTTNAEELTGHAEGLAQMAGTHIQTEAANERGVNRIRDLLA